MKKLVLFVMIILISMAPLFAGSWEETGKICPDDRFAYDNFGTSLALSGNYAIVGAYLEDENASGADPLSGAGSAYIYFLDGGTWTQQAKIVASDRSADDNFGYSVSIDGDYAVVGAYFEDEDETGDNTLSKSGAAYIFHRSGTTWTQQAKIVASDRKINDYFGKCVSISGDRVVVGALYNDYDASGDNYVFDAGSAYIFARDGSTWTQEAKLVASDRYDSDAFGSRISISGTKIIVGSQLNNFNATGLDTLADAGAAYIFAFDGFEWTQEAKLVNSDRIAGDYFGSDVAISGNKAIVGAQREDEDATGADSKSAAGSAYVFNYNGSTWSQEAKLVASDRSALDYFGISVAIDSNKVVVGAFQEDDDIDGLNYFSNSGSAYAFSWNGSTWNEESKLTATQRNTNDYFGYCVSISDDQIMVACDHDDEDANELNTVADAGSVYPFTYLAEVETPITLASFTASTHMGAIELAWETATETNNARFIIYRNNEAIGCVDGAGTTTEPHYYNFVDNNVIPGVTYTYILADIDLANNETRYDDQAISLTLSNDLIEVDFKVGAAYPNPFNPTAIVPVELTRNAMVSAKLYDMSGHEIKTLLNANATAGSHELYIDGSDLTSGIYLVKIVVENVINVQKISLMK